MNTRIFYSTKQNNTENGKMFRYVYFNFLNFNENFRGIDYKSKKKKRKIALNKIKHKFILCILEHQLMQK